MANPEAWLVLKIPWQIKFTLKMMSLKSALAVLSLLLTAQLMDKVGPRLVGQYG